MELEGISQGGGLKQPMTHSAMNNQSIAAVPKKAVHQPIGNCVKGAYGIGAQYVGASKLRTQHGLNEIHCV
jgi:hypothetical protein